MLHADMTQYLISGRTLYIRFSVKAWGTCRFKVMTSGEAEQSKPWAHRRDDDPGDSSKVDGQVPAAKLEWPRLKILAVDDTHQDWYAICKSANSV